MHLHEQPVIGHVAARIDQRPLAVIDDQELVGLHGLASGIIHQVVEHQTLVFAVIE